jgi:hypothetical protein
MTRHDPRGSPARRPRDPLSLDAIDRMLGPGTRPQLASLDAVDKLLGVGIMRPQKEEAGSSSCDLRPIIRIGLPYGSDGELMKAVRRTGAPVLLSTGGLYRKASARRAEAGFTPFPKTAWSHDMALDSAGFTAMLQGGYQWTADAYVEWMAENGRGAEDSGRPFPFTWWSAMDVCCEPEIAKDRAEVSARIDQTVDYYGQCFSLWLYYIVDEGFGGAGWFPEPMPILQGRTPADYVLCAQRLAEVRSRLLAAPSSSGLSYQDELGGFGERERGTDLPELVGIGSVCRREVSGPEGIVPVVDALDRVLPKRVRLHLFGVKGQTLSALGPLLRRVLSIDSMAWDFAAREDAKAKRKANEPLEPGETSHYSVKMRGEHLERWYEKQMQRLEPLASSLWPLASGSGPRVPSGTRKGS